MAASQICWGSGLNPEKHQVFENKQTTTTKTVVEAQMSNWSFLKKKMRLGLVQGMQWALYIPWDVCQAQPYHKTGTMNKRDNKRLWVPGGWKVVAEAARATGLLPLSLGL